MHTFTKQKYEFDNKHGSKTEFECFLPVNTTLNKKIKIKGKSGKPNEEYFKWQFLSAIINSGMFVKDFIGTSVSFPKGNKSSAPLQMDGAIFDAKDGEIITEAILAAQQNPIVRSFDERKLKYRPRALKAKIGLVTVPESEEEETFKEEHEEKKPKEHTEIQWHLLKLGSDMGFDLWAARNDRNRSWDGKKFADFKKLKTELPSQFDDATNRTIELIDVLWLKGNAIVAAFEIESTTSIYSGLLRMSDLIVMQPNINIPLYLVAPDERREKVISEVNRPTFSKLPQPLSEVCRFIAFSTLKDQIKAVSHILRFIKPEFLEEISESCEIEEV